MWLSRGRRRCWCIWRNRMRSYRCLGLLLRAAGKRLGWRRLGVQVVAPPMPSDAVAARDWAVAPPMLRDAVAAGGRAVAPPMLRDAVARLTRRGTRAPRMARAGCGLSATWRGLRFVTGWRMRGR